jgi:hypothetical protein
LPSLPVSCISYTLRAAWIAPYNYTRQHNYNIFLTRITPHAREKARIFWCVCSPQKSLHNHNKKRYPTRCLHGFGSI